MVNLYWDEIRPRPTDYEVATLRRLDRIIALLEQQAAKEGDSWALNSNPSPEPKS